MSLLIPFLGLASAAASFFGHQPSTPCLAGKRAAMIEGRFSGVVFCSRKNVSFVLTGRTTGNKYSVYDYRYRYVPHPGGVMHRGQRLIVFQGNRYVGQYMLNIPPELTIAVSGTTVMLKGNESGKTVRLDFSRKPPRRILVNGEVETFFR